MLALYKTSTLELRRIFRNKYFVMFSILMPVLFYVIYTTSFGASMQIEGTTWNAYFLISMTCFSLMSASVQTFGIQLIYDKQQPWMNWMLSQPIKRAEYFLGRLASQMVLNLLIILFLFSSIRMWQNIDFSIMKWIGIVLWVWIGILPFLALGTFISALKSPDTASAISNLLALGLALIGGLWMPLSQMPEVVRVIGEWTPSYLYAKGAWSLLANQPIPMTSLFGILAYFLLFMAASLVLHNLTHKE